MSRHFTAAMVFLLTLRFMPSGAFAEKRGGSDHGKHHRKSLEEKFFKKVRMIYLYGDELSVSHDQMDKIKT